MPLAINKMKRTVQISLLITSAVVFQIVETMIPHPIPWLRLGLANMVTLVGIVLFGFLAGIQVAVLRTVLSSFILGTFFTPTFFMSFAGALMAALIMGILYRFPMGFGIIGVSISGALVHNFTQLVVAYLFLVRHKGIFLLMPFLILSALVTGYITGYGADYILKRTGHL